MKRDEAIQLMGRLVQVKWIIPCGRNERNSHIYRKEVRTVRLRRVYRTRASVEFQGKSYRVRLDMLTRPVVMS